MDVAVSVWYPVKAAAVFAAIVMIAGSRWRDHHPFPTFGLANRITTVRACLVALAAGLIGEGSTLETAASAIAFGAAATALDGVDGWAARRARMASAFGARYDMEVDALLVQVLAILVWRHGKAGAWVLLSGLMRYIFFVAGRIWPWLRRPVFPSLLRKTICVVQITGLLVALLPRVVPPASTAVAAVSLAILTYSFLVDTVWLWQQR